MEWIEKKIGDVLNSRNQHDIQELIKSIDEEILKFEKNSEERKKLLHYKDKLEAVIVFQEDARMQEDYLSKAKQSASEDDWDYVRFLLTKYFENHQDENAFSNALDILRKLTEPQALKKQGRDVVVSFLRTNIPVQFQGKKDYKDLQEAASSVTIPINNDDTEPKDADAFRSKQHGGRIDLIQKMDEAIEVLYSYDFDRAISLFEQVLEDDPNYERAREHLAEAKEYKAGKIPPPRIPQNISRSLGRAMSLFKGGQYKLAQQELDNIYKALAEKNIPEWEQLSLLQQSITDNVTAENQYNAARESFNRGQIDDAKDKITGALAIIPKPKYEEFKNNISEFEEQVASLRRKLALGGAADDQITTIQEVKQVAEELAAKYPLHRVIEDIQKRISDREPMLRNGLIKKAESLVEKIDQDRYSGDLSHALSLAKQALQAIDEAEKAGAMGQDFEQVKTNAQNKVAQLENFDRRLSEAENHLVDENTFFWTRWQKAYASILPVMQQYPRDSRVQKLRSELKTRDRITTLMRVIVGIILIAVLFSCSVGAYTFARTKIAALTPSPTITPSITPSPTVTTTSTLQPTATPTLTVTPTPLPLSYIAEQELVVRFGCYETFRIVGRIPAGSKVLPDWSSETKDDFDRTCLFVKYERDTGEIISGYILLKDLVTANSP